MLKKGFTLVELSIVLVIIGLLIGGILVGQSLIQSASIASAVSQIQQYDAATVVFKDKYRALPGDAESFGGDGNGAIDIGVIAAREFVSSIACEHTNFWNHILPQSFVGSACSGSGAAATTSGADKNVPLSKVGKSGSFYITSALAITGAPQAITADIQNYYVMLAPTQGQAVISSFYRASATTSANSAATPQELLSLDNKIDDALANSGNVISGRINSAFAADSTPLATCSSGASYEVDNTGYECTPLIRIGAQAGDPQ